MSDSAITPEIMAIIAPWIETARSGTKSRKELVEEFYELKGIGIIGYMSYEKEIAILSAIDMLLGNDVDDTGMTLISDFRRAGFVSEFLDIPEPSSFFTYTVCSPGCCYDNEEEITVLVLKRGLFTCKVADLPKLESNFAHAFLARANEEVMRAKFISAFEPDRIMRTWLDRHILRSYIDERDKVLPREWCESTEQGWMGEFHRELYPGAVGELMPRRDREGGYYIVRRAAVFTCDVRFFSSKEEGEAVAEEMRVAKAARMVVLESEYEKTVAEYAKFGAVPPRPAYLGAPAGGAGGP